MRLLELKQCALALSFLVAAASAGCGAAKEQLGAKTDPLNGYALVLGEDVELPDPVARGLSAFFCRAVE